MDAIKAEPYSEDETHPSDSDARQVDTKQEDLSDPFTFVEVKCEIEVGQFSEDEASY
jgi:hypothetical protein